MDYKEAVSFLEERAGRGSLMGLQSIKRLLREMGDPQKELRFIHIAGTNGKGSAAACLSSILKEGGICTGTYTSPAVVSERERYQTDGRWISETDFAGLVWRVREAALAMEARGWGAPTVFEMETAMAFLYFREMGCRLVVLETGLGGEGDATNVAEHTAAAVFTSISRDHMGILGDTLPEIAACKAGIMKPGCVVLSGDQDPLVTDVLKARAARLGCPFIQVDKTQITGRGNGLRGQRFSYRQMEDLEISLAGPYQMENGALALETALALREQGYDISERAIREGLKNAVWPGRFQILMESPFLIVDGAHNRDGALKLRQCVETCLKGRRIILIMGVFKDKEYDEICRIMVPLAEMVYTVELPNRDRSLSPAKLAREAGRYCNRTQAADSVETALDLALGNAGKEDAVLAFGSLSYLGQVMREAERRRQEHGGQR